MKLVSKKLAFSVLAVVVISFSSIALSDNGDIDVMLDKNLTAGNTSGGWPPPTSKSFWDKLFS